MMNNKIQLAGAAKRLVRKEARLRTTNNWRSAGSLGNAMRKLETDLYREEDLFYPRRSGSQVSSVEQRAEKTLNGDSVNIYVQKKLIEKELEQKNLLQGLKQKDPEAIKYAASLQNIVEFLKLYRTQEKVEQDRRLESAKALRAMMNITVAPEENYIASRPLNSVAQLPRFKVEKLSNLDFKLDLEQERIPVRPIMAHYKAWFANLTAAIEEDKEKRTSSPGYLDYAPVFQLLPTDLLATVVLQEFLNFLFLNKVGVPFVTAVTKVGRSVYEELNALHAKFSSDTWKELRWKLAAETGELDHFQMRARDKIVDVNWGPQVYTKVGARLVELLCKSCFVLPDLEKMSPEEEASLLKDGQIPAFYHSYAAKNNQVVGMIVMHQALIHKLLRTVDSEQIMQIHAPNHRPMVCPPKEWTRPFNGGFLDTRLPIIRAVRGSNETLKLLHRLKCDELFEGVSILGRVPWQLNSRVADIAKQVQDDDLGITGLPLMSGNAMSEIESILNQKPPLPDPEQGETKGSRSYQKRKVAFKATQERAKRDRQEWNSKHLDFTFKLDLAEFVKDYKQFWFPYSLDFRGRAYPIPPVSHMGDDLARAILKFKEGRRLGEKGMYWLKVHMANQMGYDKASFQDRVAWTEERMDLLLESAREPIDPNEPSRQKWWATADKPWQALATCFEIANAMQLKNPADYISHLPVHQDGSCNGLQHYAALGRDRSGGEKVNLVRGDKPGDVYTAVADKVREIVEQDAKEFNPEQDIPYKDSEMDFTLRGTLNPRMIAYIAEHMKDQITRKLVKQTVMTSVYGVTFIGAREQIERRVEEMNEKNSFAKVRGEPHGHIFGVDELFSVSNYLARVTLQSIGATFKSAKEIQSWLGGLAKVSTSLGQPVSWITPLGLPVVQPYRSEVKKSISTGMQMVILAEYSENSPVHKVKQRNAFPPNFVHSIDSTHMLMTARECHKQGLSFTAVHDSYWTHPGDTDQMNQILREQFVKLHEQPLLEDLRRQFVVRYPQFSGSIQDPPMVNTLDIQEVLDSPYFFS